MKFSKDKSVLVLVLFLIVIIVAIVLLISERNSLTEYYSFDNSKQEFKKNITPAQDPDITDLASDDNNESNSLNKILRGYFHSYNQEQKTLSLKNDFIISSDLQLLTVSTEKLSNFYCWPGTISTDLGIIETESMQFYIYPNNQDITMPGEKNFTMDLLESFLQKDQYLIVQLTQSFNIEANNFAQKIILLDCKF